MLTRCHLQVGYGDIIPGSDLEMLFACFAMLLGATIFGYIVGSLAAIIGNQSSRSALLKEQLDMVNNYMREQSVTRSLQRKIIMYYKLYLANTSVYDDFSILQELPSNLRRSIVLHLVRYSRTHTTNTTNHHHPTLASFHRILHFF